MNCSITLTFNIRFGIKECLLSQNMYRCCLGGGRLQGGHTLKTILRRAFFLPLAALRPWAKALGALAPHPYLAKFAKFAKFEKFQLRFIF